MGKCIILNNFRQYWKKKIDKLDFWIFYKIFFVGSCVINKKNKEMYENIVQFNNIDLKLHVFCENYSGCFWQCCCMMIQYFTYPNTLYNQIWIILLQVLGIKICCMPNANTMSFSEDQTTRVTASIRNERNVKVIWTTKWL